MDIRSISTYILPPVLGAYIGYSIGTTLKSAQVWKSSHGGRIACVVANKIPANSKCIDKGFTFAYSATVPEDYECTGPLISKKWLSQTVVTGCVSLGVLVSIAAIPTLLDM